MDCPKCKKGNLIPSKFGGNWCANCRYTDKPKTGYSGYKKVSNQKVLEAVRIVNQNLTLLINEFRAFAKIFGEKQ